MISSLIDKENISELTSMFYVKNYSYLEFCIFP